MRVFPALVAICSAIDDFQATKLIQSELSRYEFKLHLPFILLRCQTYDFHHETCVENIRSSFANSYNLTVTCAFTSDWMNVGAVTYWFGNVENYGAVMCGELTHTEVRQT